MNDFHFKIDAAKKLLLRRTAIDGKEFTFKSLGIWADILIALFKDGFIDLSDCTLSKEYVDFYKHGRKEYEGQQQRIATASLSGGTSYDPKKAEGWKHYLSDKHCGLPEATYRQLMRDGNAKVNILDFENTIGQQTTPLSFISFKLQIHQQKVEHFLQSSIELFINDELNLATKDTDRFFSYELQKEQFAIGMQRQMNAGYPHNNLKMDYTQIWDKHSLLQTNFLEVALSMEQQELIEIKEIIQPSPPSPSVVLTSDFLWQYPTTIRLKVLGKFAWYYDEVYKKLNPPPVIPMTPDEKFDRGMWTVLQKMREQQLYFNHKGDRGTFYYSSDWWGDEKIEEHQTLEALQDWGAIALKEDMGASPTSVDYAILRPKFDEVYSLYESGQTYRGAIINNPPKTQKESGGNGETLGQPGVTLDQGGLHLLPGMSPTSTVENKEINKPNHAEQHIEKIECLRHETNTSKLTVFINGDYQSPLEVKLKKNWTRFYELADKQQVAWYKPFFDYFNSTHGNPIYSRLGYQKTQVLKFDGGVRIIPKVTIAVITRQKFSRRRNKAA